MSFRRNDYHNSRTYEADPPTPAAGGLSLAIAWAKLQLDKLLRSGTPTSIATYSVLGSDGHDRPSGKLETSVFPTADREPGFQTRLQPARANAARRHDRRVER